MGFLLTLAFLHGLKALATLCLAGCRPKRAWPDCCCWKKVSLECTPTPSKNNQSFASVLQVSGTHQLVNDVVDVEDSLSGSSLAPSSHQSPSLCQQFRAHCCTCLGHHA